MSFKGLLFLVPVALGGWYVARGDQEALPPGVEGVRAQAKATGPRKTLEQCRELEQRMLEAGAADPPQGGLATVRRVRAMYYELRRLGCNPGEGRSFEAPVNRMGRPPPYPPARPNTDVSFEPGQPMVDVGGSEDGR